MTAFTQEGWRKGSAVVLGLVLMGLALTCGLTSLRWMNTPFPGFVVLANNVVASVSLPRWSLAEHGPQIYQHAIVAVNERPVATSADVYAAVRQLPADTPITYTLKKNDQISQVTLASQLFTLQDYVFLFGGYLFTGLAIAAIGIGVWFLQPTSPASWALLIGAGSSGLFFVTAVDLYGPHWFFRLHVLTEPFLAAGFIHLAVVFPADRFQRFRSLLISLPYGLAFSLGLAYEVLLFRPAAYSLIHALCEMYIASCGLSLLVAATWDYWTTESHLTRQRIRIILVGLIGGLALPAALTLFSSLTGGQVAVNYSTLTVFLFPLSLGYAIVKHDLFEIDALLKRGIFYLTLTVSLTLSYFAFLALINFTLSFSEFSHSLAFPLLFTFGVVFFLSPLKDALQRTIDRVFFRLRYNPKQILETTSAALASTFHLEEILSLIWQTLQDTLGVKHGGVFLKGDNAQYLLAHPQTLNGQHLLPAPSLLEAIQRTGRIVPYDDLANGTFSTQLGKEGQQAFAQLGSQLWVPLIFKEELVGVFVLGPKESGSFFAADDMNFLRALANQSALSIANARAYQKIRAFNTALEKKVEERTQALAAANTQLHVSLEQREQAYQDLKRSQESLLRTEKMAVLGRLTAGIAHEMNTPLGASLNSLKVMERLVAKHEALGQELTATPSSSLGSLQDLNRQMHQAVGLAQQCITQATSHIQSLKLHTRDLQRDERKTFGVLQTIENTRVLLTHRLRLSDCSLVVGCEGAAPLLYGDPGKLGQVLTNLLDNAIDAYDETTRGGGEIQVAITTDGPVLEIRVCDHGCGIASEEREQIFDECFSSKPLGKGTGLGLSISRDIIANFFGGTLHVESTLGQGSVFIIRIPQKLL